MDNQLIIEILLFIRKFINIVIPIFTWGLIIYILSSWLPALRESVVGETLGKIYEPIMEPVRKLIPPLGGMIDLSPIILLIGLRLFQGGLESIFQAIIISLQ